MSLSLVGLMLIIFSWSGCSKSDGVIAIGTDAMVKFKAGGKSYTHLVVYCTYRDSTLTITSNAVIPDGNSPNLALQVTGVLDVGLYHLDDDGLAPEVDFLALTTPFDAAGGGYITDAGYAIVLNITRIDTRNKAIEGTFSGNLVYKLHGEAFPDDTMKVEDGSFLVYYF